MTTPYIWVPCDYGIPPSPPGEQRIKRRQDWKKQNAPIRCPGLAPAAWREFQAMPLGVGAYRSGKPSASTPSVSTLPVAYWKFESDGSDATGRGNTLTGSGTPTFTTGKIGNALTLASASHQFEQKTSASGDLAFGTGVHFTIAGWVKLSSNINPGIIVQIGGSGSVFGPNLDIRWNGGSVRWEFFTSSGGGAVSPITTTDSIATDLAWHFVWAQWDGTNWGLSIDNGTLHTATGQNAGTNSNTFTVGAGYTSAFGGGFGGYWNGQIDSLGIYKVVLTSGDRTSLYNGGNGFDPV